MSGAEKVINLKIEKSEFVSQIAGENGALDAQRMYKGLNGANSKNKTI